MKSICVYCGSSMGNKESYRIAAVELGEKLVAENLSLVYGGGNIGLMGVLADTVMKNGGKVIGIIPDKIFKLEVAHENITDLQVVDSMHERKARMAEIADGFIALPGGLGTLDELIEILTWAQLDYHQKPCGILNVSGYFNPLLKFIDHASEEGFVKKEHAAMLQVSDSSCALIDKLKNYNPVSVSKL